MAHLCQAEGGEHHRFPVIAAVLGGIEHQGDHDHGEHDADADDVTPNAPGEDRFARLRRRLLH